MDKIIDVHIHDPYIYNVNKKMPKAVAEELLILMNKYNVEYAFLYALEADPLKPPKNISKKRIYKSIEDAINRGIYVLPSIIMNAIKDYDKAMHDHISTLKTVFTPTERVVKIARYSKNRILPIGSIRLSGDPREDLERIRELVKMNIRGFKLYPTIQFLKPRDKKLHPIYEVLEKNGITLFIHTGCDPGLWELPELCETADPKNVADVAERFPRLRIVLCHMGAYSALKPGIFLDNATTIVNKYDNVYGDISAVEPDIIKYIVQKTDYRKIMFGSDFPVTGRDWGSLIDNIRLLDMSEDIKRRILYLNAKEIFAL